MYSTPLASGDVYLAIHEQKIIFLKILLPNLHIYSRLFCHTSGNNFKNNIQYEQGLNIFHRHILRSEKRSKFNYPVNYPWFATLWTEKNEAEEVVRFRSEFQPDQTGLQPELQKANRSIIRCRLFIDWWLWASYWLRQITCLDVYFYVF